MAADALPSTLSSTLQSQTEDPVDSTEHLTFTLRHARMSDLDIMSRILTAAFWDEDAMGRFLHSKREQFPEDVRRWWRNSILKSLVGWNYDAVLAVDSETKKVVGVSIWERQGPTAQKSKGRGWRWNLRFVLQALVKFKVSLSNLIHPNRANGDPSALTAFERAIPFMEHMWAPPRDDQWQLLHLGVDPTQQGKGFGRALAAWGLDRAKEENVAASVVSAAGKENFYRRCGFVTTVGNVTEGEGNPLGGIQGGVVLFRDKV